LGQQIYTPFSISYEIPVSDQVFVAQTRIIKKLANQGPCIIVGRCADRVLDSSVNLFIYAGIEERIQRLNSLNTGVDPKTMEKRIREMDQKRKDYYQYYTGCEWGKAQNYHLSLDSGIVGVRGCFQATMAYLESI
jgi:cytidylate kinase